MDYVCSEILNPGNQVNLCFHNTEFTSCSRKWRRGIGGQHIFWLVYLKSLLYQSFKHIFSCKHFSSFIADILSSPVFIYASFITSFGPKYSAFSCIHSNKSKTFYFCTFLWQIWAKSILYKSAKVKTQCWGPTYLYWWQGQLNVWSNTVLLTLEEHLISQRTKKALCFYYLLNQPKVLFFFFFFLNK